MLILKYKDKRLRIKKKLFFLNVFFTNFIIKHMLIKLYKNNGIGISGKQVSLNLKIIIVDISFKKNKPIIILNLNILSYNKFHTLGTEGCLSIKNYFNSVPRCDKIFCEFNNIYNKKKIRIFNGIYSRCIQHEFDHLKGIMIQDYSNSNIFNLCQII